MRCFVSAGPTWEPVDRVRRLTNFSTGELGGRLANRLAAAGHSTTLFLGEMAVWNAPLSAVEVRRFSTTESLAECWRAAATGESAACFQVAAVSDFTAGGLYRHAASGTPEPVISGKVSTREGELWLKLRPTPKVLPRLREWFPAGRIAGWKYEVEGSRAEVERAARRQFQEASHDLCVMNGPAYGDGFGLMDAGGQVRPVADRAALLEALARWVSEGGA